MTDVNTQLDELKERLAEAEDRIFALKSLEFAAAQGEARALARLRVAEEALKKAKQDSIKKDPHCLIQQAEKTIGVHLDNLVGENVLVHCTNGEISSAEFVGISEDNYGCPLAYVRFEKSPLLTSVNITRIQVVN